MGNDFQEKPDVLGELVRESAKSRAAYAQPKATRTSISYTPREKHTGSLSEPLPVFIIMMVCGVLLVMTCKLVKNTFATYEASYKRYAVSRWVSAFSASLRSLPKETFGFIEKTADKWLIPVGAGLLLCAIPNLLDWKDEIHDFERSLESWYSIQTVIAVVAIGCAVATWISFGERLRDIEDRHQREDEAKGS